MATLQLDRLIFINGKVICTLPSKRYRLIEIKLLKGESLDGFRLNIVSYIGEVRSNVPIIFTELTDIEYLNPEATTAKISVKLDFRDKTDIQLILTSPPNIGEYEFIIDYELL